MANAIIESPNKTNCSYSIAAPGVLRSNAIYNVVIILFDVSESCDVQITISGGSYKDEKIVTIQPNSTETLCFEVPELDPYELYFIDAKSLTGIEFDETLELLFDQGQILTYIQFDKQAYKRQDKVEYRVLLLERELLRPFSANKPIAVCLKILDKLIFENKIELETGVYTGHWEIPADASHGSYVMQIFVGETIVCTKTFDVIDYMPPKFQLDVTVPKELVYLQKQFIVDVEAKNFDNTPIDGICKLEFESVAGFFSGVYMEKYLPICGTIPSTIIDVVEDLDIDNSFIDSEWFSTATIMIRATVTAKNTEDQVSLSKLVTLKRDRTVVDVDETAVCCSSRPCKDCRNCCEMEEDNYFIEEGENENPIKITLDTTKGNRLSHGEKLHFSIKIKKPTSHCVFFVTARGNIIHHELIKVENHTVPITRDLETTFIYVPRAFILAYIIYDDILYFDEIGFNLSHTFENTLSIAVPEKAVPNAVLPLEIESAPSSLIGIMAVDSKSVVINSTNDLSYGKFFKDLYHVRSQVPEMNASGRYPGLMSGIVTFTNSKMDGFETDESEDGRYSFFPDREHFQDDDRMPRIDIERKKKKVMREMQEQSQVFGNWIFINKEANDKGRLNLDVTVPENASTWLLTAFAIHKERGFVMTKEPIKISANTTPNLDTKLPQTVTRVGKTQITKFLHDNYNDDEAKRIITLAPPQKAQPLEITLTITSTLFGPIIAHLRDLAGKMYCTGYLHMTTVAPNIAVLEYLDHIHRLDEEFAMSIKNRFPEAIKRDLDERREDSSFGWFSSDKNGSPHVTALVLQIYQRVDHYVTVDPEIIENGLAYLASLQMKSGEMRSEDQPYKNLFQKGSCVGLTSFVLLAFLKDKKIQQRYKTFIDKGFDYAIANIDKINCVYDLAISFYALQLYRHPYANTLKKRLFEVAKRDLEHDHMWWTYSLLPSADPNYYSAVSEREVTSYIALGLLETETIETILPILKWMLPLKELRSESMDCGLCLEVILKSAIKANAPHGIMTIDYTAYDTKSGYNGTIKLTTENAEKIQVYVLPKSTNKVEFSTKDRGTFYGYVSYRYVENEV